MRFFCKNTKVYPWYISNQIYFRGYFFHQNRLFSGIEATHWLVDRLSGTAPVEQILSSMNGIFSLIWRRENQIFFAVDRVRSMPIFYSIVGGELWLSSEAELILQELPDWSVSDESLEVYRATKLFTTGDKTLVNEIFQVQAGTYCIFQELTSEICTIPYFEMKSDELIDDEKVLLEQFYESYDAVGKRLVQVLNGRKAIIPLSGGADSRMVLEMLKNNGYDNILCFTYGSKNNQDARISKQVAEMHRCQWKYIPYTYATWKDLRKSKSYVEYCRFANGYTSTPHLQDFPAVQALIKENLLPDNSVFVPGHSGDMLAGSHITSEFLNASMTKEEFLKTIVHKFYAGGELEKHTADELGRRFEDLNDNSGMETFAAASAWFNVQERQAKFIVNSVRAYEYFGYEWLIPLWDNALFDFWAKVPITLRYQRRLYFQAVNHRQPYTNDSSLTKSFGEEVRRYRTTRTIARYLIRLLRYWRSKNYMEHLFSFPQYVCCLLKQGDLANTNYLICNQQIESLLQEMRYNSDIDDIWKERTVS